MSDIEGRRGLSSEVLSELRGLPFLLQDEAILLCDEVENLRENLQAAITAIQHEHDEGMKFFHRARRAEHRLSELMTNEEYIDWLKV